MSKLQNTKAIQQMIDGTHRMQTRKTFSFGPMSETERDQQQKREVGETWISIDPYTKEETHWKQHKGWREKNYIAGERMADLRGYLNAFQNCPKEECTCKAPTSLDKKFRSKRGMCSDCVFDEDTKLRFEGKMNDFAQEKMYKNAEDYFKNVEQELLEMCKNLEEGNMGFVQDADGNVEKWQTDDNQQIIKRLKDDFYETRDKVLQNLSKKEEVITSE